MAHLRLAAVKPPSGREHRQHRSQILQIVRSERLIEVIKVNVDGRLRAVPVRWEDFWDRVQCTAESETQRLLDQLRQARRQYIEHGFSLEHAVPYCLWYFRLLRRAVDRSTRDQSVCRLLRAIVGFECFGLRWPDQPVAVAAGTINVRNPAYLLAKLRQPEAYDDAKFLPLIALPFPDIRNRSASSLYYHYRQVRLSSQGSVSLLAYPAVDLQARPGSFDCLQTMFAGLTSRKDPRPAGRAGWIADHAIGPFLRKLDASGLLSKQRGVRIADLGSGSGALLREITAQLSQRHADCVRKAPFHWTLGLVKK